MLKNPKSIAVKMLLFLLLIGCRAGASPRASSRQSEGNHQTSLDGVNTEVASTEAARSPLRARQIREAIKLFEESGREQPRGVVEQKNVKAEIKIRGYRKSVDPLWGPVWKASGPGGALYTVLDGRPLVVQVDYTRWWEDKTKSGSSHLANSRENRAERSEKAHLKWEDAVERARTFAEQHWGEFVLRGLHMYTKPIDQERVQRYLIGWSNSCSSDVVLGKRILDITVDATTGRILQASYQVGGVPDHVVVNEERFRQMIDENKPTVPGLELECISLARTFNEDGSQNAIWAAYFKWSCDYPDWTAMVCYGSCQLIVDADTGEIIDKSCW